MRAVWPFPNSLIKTYGSATSRTPFRDVFPKQMESHNEAAAPKEIHENSRCEPDVCRNCHARKTKYRRLILAFRSTTVHSGRAMPAGPASPDQLCLCQSSERRVQ